MADRVRRAFALVVFGAASLTAGFGIYAFFSDTAKSTDNLFSAATVDLLINNQENIGAFITGSDLVPQAYGYQTPVSGSVTLKNAGTLTGAAVDLDVAISISQAVGYGYATGILAPYLRIDSLSYGGSSISITDVNANGFPDLDDWDQNNQNTRDLSEPGAGKSFSLSIFLDGSAPNTVQAASSTVTFTFFLAQVAAPDQPA